MPKLRRTGATQVKRKPARRETQATPVDSPSGTRWLLLIHQIPPKPDYLRVKIGRRLQRVGAVAIKNSVYVLPPAPDSYEDFQWIVREIEEGGGDAFVSEASLVGEGLTDDAVRALFNAARNEEHGAILADARSLLTDLQRYSKRTARRNSASRPNASRQALEHELAKLRRRYESVKSIDFFGASVGDSLAAKLSEIQRALHQNDSAPRGSESATRLDGAAWVTRRDVHVDRIASAWLIRRFIDRRPTFRFVDPKRWVHHEAELRFDMFEAEYTHVGDACTFETLLAKFGLKDPALREIAEIVHDVDCKDGKFGRDEAPGLARMIAGVAILCARDEDRIDRGSRLFDELYAAFSRGAVK